MKTTLIIDDQVFSRLKQEAARQGTTISRLVETALRQMLEKTAPREPLPPLPRFKGGEWLVDVSSRNELDDATEGH
ncbi:MAG: hypothetical protein ACYCW6_05170 [Candidatus Xenobia bacterium]